LGSGQVPRVINYPGRCTWPLERRALATSITLAPATYTNSKWFVCSKICKCSMHHRDDVKLSSCSVHSPLLVYTGLLLNVPFLIPDACYLFTAAYKRMPCACNYI
jgi:hypothetical protein